MESLAPPVVIVIVTHDPGPWFETTLRAIGEQSYPEKSVLVLDAASSSDPTKRVASVLPDAFVRRLSTNEGFGPSANEAGAMVEGADFLLFCHDDVAPEPDALRHMVEEAYRSNAGVVGPKFVDWDDPDRILHVGVQVDKSGAVVDRVERGEVDAGQHDAVRDVFSTPGGFTLVRSDLFAELGGFDPHIVVMGEDLDLCWRAQIAGARVIVAPDAKVRHLELLASGKRSAPTKAGLEEGTGEPDTGERVVSMQELQRRAELHVALKAYGPWHRIRVLPQIALLALVEMLVLRLVGRAQRAREVARAWTWNFGMRRATRLERREVRSIRRVSDSELRQGQIRGSARVSKYLRLAFTQGLAAAHLGLDDPVAGPISVRAGRNAKGGRQSFVRRPTPRVIAWIVMALIVLIGVRQLLSGGLPVLGQFLRIPSPGSLLGQFASGQHQFGSPSAGFATPATLVLGLAGYIVFGSVSLLQTVLVVACLPVGAIGAARLCRSFASGWAPVVAAGCYLAIPIPYDDIATGRLDALFVYAAVPWIMLAMARASGLEPLAAAEAAGESRRVVRKPLFVSAVSLGVGESVLVAFDPPAALVTLVLGVALSLGILVTFGVGSARAAGRVMVTTLGALATTIALLAPWSVSVLAGSAPLDILTGTRPGPYTNVGWGALLRLAPGPIGGTPLVFGLLIAAALPLFIGRKWRLSWAGRMWVCALVAWVACLCTERGWLGSLTVLPAQFLPIAACGLAFSTAMGVTAFTLDLPASRFGWRQVMSALAGCAAVVGALPALAAAGGGRFDLPGTGFTEVLSWMSSAPSASSSGVVWLGDGAVVPGRAWPLTSGLDYSVDAGGIPDLTSLWMGPPSASNQQVASDIQLASAGKTVELGQLLAARSIRYVVVVEALAPDVPGLQQPRADPPPAALLSALDSQIDLRQLPTQGGYEVYDNPEFVAPSSPAAVRAPAGNGLAISGEIVLWALVISGLVVLRRRRSGETKSPPGGRGVRFALHRSRAPGPPESPESPTSSPRSKQRDSGQSSGSAADEPIVANGSAGRADEHVHGRHTRTRRAVRTEVGSRGDHSE